MRNQTSWSDRLLRFLHSLPAIACFALCVLLMVLWMRSYHWINKASFCYATGGTGNLGAGPTPQYRTFHVSAKNGCLMVQRDTDFFIVPGQELAQTGITIWPSHRVSRGGNGRGFLRGFFFNRSAIGQATLSIPLWFLSMTTAAAGTLLWMQRPYRFTLRGALVATTFIAVVLGMGVALSR